MNVSLCVDGADPGVASVSVEAGMKRYGEKHDLEQYGDDASESAERRLRCALFALQFQFPSPVMIRDRIYIYKYILPRGPNNGTGRAESRSGGNNNGRMQSLLPWSWHRVESGYRRKKVPSVFFFAIKHAAKATAKPG